jgi:SAM-dependent methyltransferase
MMVRVGARLDSDVEEFGDIAPSEFYLRFGRKLQRAIVEFLPEEFSFTGARILDFGCGSGRVLRHFRVQAGETDEFWACDLHAPTVAWMDEHLSPPFRVFRNPQEPPLDFPDGHFDLITCISVYTHLADDWSAWMVEHHRLLKPGGLLVATVLGPQFARHLGENVNESTVGMLALRLGNDLDDSSGPLVFHSRWWLEEHWGRAFDIEHLQMKGFARANEIPQGVVVGRRKDVPVDRERLERPGRAKRELVALRTERRHLAEEARALRAAAERWRRRASAQNSDETEADGGPNGKQQLETRLARGGICVLGMHRSGTSLAAGILAALGLYLGPEDELLGPTPDNPSGHFESKALVELNDEILETMGGRWNAPPPLDPGWQGDRSLNRVRARARGALSERFAGHTSWGWKDPRTSLTLPLWQDLVPGLRYVLCFRNPCDVVASLKARGDRRPPRALYDDWLRHSAAALVHTSSRPRLVVLHERFFTDADSQVCEVARFARLAEDGAAAAHAKELIDPGLLHTNRPMDSVFSERAARAEVGALYLAVRLASDPDIAAQERLDRWRGADGLARRILQEAQADRKRVKRQSDAAHQERGRRQKRKTAAESREKRGT